MCTDKIFLPLFCVSGNKPFSMKRTALLLLVAFVFFSCKKETGPPLGRIIVGNMQFTIQAGINPSLTHYIPINDVQINALAQLDAAGIDTSQITRIQPSQARVKVLFGNGDLDFIDALSVRLCPQDQNEINCGREAYYRDPTPFDIGQELEIGPGTASDLRELLFLKNINVQVKLERMRDVPTNTFDVQLEMEFDVR
jgi:hypothetical protein